MSRQTSVVSNPLRDALIGATWNDWRTVRCPTLVVRGDGGSLAAETVDRMIEALPAAHVATVPAGHNMHLRAPEQRRQALTGLFDRLQSNHTE